MLDIGKLIPRDAPMICDFCFSSMLDIGKLILQMIISSIIA